MKALHIAIGIVLASTLSTTDNATTSPKAETSSAVMTAASRPHPASVASRVQTYSPAMQEIDPIIRSAIRRFEVAGLELPDLTVVVFDSTIDCDGSSGYYFASSKILHVCLLDEKTVLHELAHAWAGHMLSNAQRTSFAELRGTDGWNNIEDDWKDRATEQAAETIAWALADQERTVTWVLEDGTATRRLLTIDNSSPNELAEAYRQLTGSELPPDRLVIADQPPSNGGPELQRVRSAEGS